MNRPLHIASTALLGILTCTILYILPAIASAQEPIKVPTIKSTTKQKNNTPIPKTEKVEKIPMPDARTTGNSLDLQARCDGKVYYFNAQEWNALTYRQQQLFTPEGVLLMVGDESFAVALTDEWTGVEVDWYEAMKYYAGSMPTKAQAELILKYKNVLNEAIKSYYGWELLYSYWTCDEYNTTRAWDLEMNGTSLFNQPKSDNFKVRTVVDNKKSSKPTVKPTITRPTGSTYGENLDLQVKSKGKTLYFSPVEWDALTPAQRLSYTPQGVLVKIGNDAFIVALDYEMNGKEITWDEAMLIYSTSLPTKQQANILFNFKKEISRVIEAYYGGTAIDKSSFWTRDEAEDSMAWKCLNGGGVSKSNKDKYPEAVRKVITLTPDATASNPMPDARTEGDNMDLQVKFKGHTFYFTPKEWNLLTPAQKSVYSIDGVLVKANIGRFVVALHDELNGKTIPWENAQGIYDNYMPSKIVGKAILQNKNQINEALKAFGGTTMREKYITSEKSPLFIDMDNDTIKTTTSLRADGKVRRIIFDPDAIISHTIITPRERANHLDLQVQANGHTYYFSPDEWTELSPSQKKTYHSEGVVIKDGAFMFTVALRNENNGNWVKWNDAMILCGDSMPTTHQLSMIFNNEGALNGALRAYDGKTLSYDYWSEKEKDKYDAWCYSKYSTRGPILTRYKSDKAGARKVGKITMAPPRTEGKNLDLQVKGPDGATYYFDAHEWKTLDSLQKQYHPVGMLIMAEGVEPFLLSLKNEWKGNNCYIKWEDAMKAADNALPTLAQGKILDKFEVEIEKNLKAYGAKDYGGFLWTCEEEGKNAYVISGRLEKKSEKHIARKVMPFTPN